MQIFYRQLKYDYIRIRWPEKWILMRILAIFDFHVKKGKNCMRGRVRLKLTINSLSFTAVSC